MDIVTLGAALSGAKAYTDATIAPLLGGVHYRGSVNYFNNLPSNPAEGDAYTVKYSGTSGTNPDGTEYVWALDTDDNTYKWIGFSPDTYTKAEVDNLLSGKQDTLVVGTNLDDVPTEDSTNPITSGGVFNTVGNIDAALDSLIMSLEPKTITANGIYDPTDDGVDGYSEVTVNVPNTYTAGDNGKVVSNQQLVSQTAYPTTITENDTYDTTNYNSITVNVSGGGGSSTGLTIEGLPGLGGMFANNSDITSVIIGSDFEYIGDSEFQDCSALTSVTISSSVTSIGADAFQNCTSLETVTFEANSNLEAIYAEAFEDCSALTSITIPNSVTIIDFSAFAYCSELTSVMFEANSNLETIGDSAFNSCESLASITIPDSVTSINGYAFAGCSALASITIPDSVTSINGLAFADCSALTSITFEATTPPDLGDDLGLPTTCIIRVPQGTLSDYTSASYYPDPNDYTYVEY